MKRFHVNVAVADLARSLRFYSNLFGAEPTVSQGDYAKWMLEDPRLNFSISQSGSKRGIQHVGLQAETTEEFGEIQQRLARAGETTFDQPETECCYARSSKTWARDPDNLTWETFITHKQIGHFGNAAGTSVTTPVATTGKRCCA
jgi:catechol 2,3-dioxygenase-like lactoylglutathione lyase family enzyme